MLTKYKRVTAATLIGRDVAAIDREHHWATRRVVEGDVVGDGAEWLHWDGPPTSCLLDSEVADLDCQLVRSLSLRVRQEATTHD